MPEHERDAAVHEWVVRTTRAQRLPEKIEDEATLRDLAALFADAQRGARRNERPAADSPPTPGAKESRGRG